MNSNSFFAGSRLKAHEILLMSRLWLAKVTVTSAVELTGHSENTVVVFWNYFRQLVASAIDVEDTIIGGEDVVVEVDETKLGNVSNIGKRKYNRGHRVEGVWVVVGVERTEQRRVFAVPVKNRESLTLQRVIHDHVHPGSIIHTDLWKAYGWIDERPYFNHATVNHSLNFKDPITMSIPTPLKERILG
jgi:transposase-like protein